MAKKIRKRRANYFDNPELLVFDAKCDINVQFNYTIFDD